MVRYRRVNTTGATYFFTVVSYRRQAILCDEPIRTVLREAIAEVTTRHPFAVDAWVLLPDHLHCIRTLPSGDADFATRWALIKRRVSQACGDIYRRDEWLTPSKQKHRESALWRRRYREHRIRDENDSARHADYIHYNPVKHGLCKAPAEWPYGTFHRHVGAGVYPLDWGAGAARIEGDFGE